MSEGNSNDWDFLPSARITLNDFRSWTLLDFLTKLLGLRTHTMPNILPDTDSALPTQPNLPEPLLSKQPPKFVLHAKFKYGDRGSLYSKPVFTGTREDVVLAFRHNKYVTAQQFVEDEAGQIVAIEVHKALLWLENVPSPKYFTPPVREEICMAGV